MNAPIKAAGRRDDIGAAMRAIGADARAAARVLALAPAAGKGRALLAMAEAVRAKAAAILIANSEDLAEAQNAGLVRRPAPQGGASPAAGSCSTTCRTPCRPSASPMAMSNTGSRQERCGTR